MAEDLALKARLLAVKGKVAIANAKIAYQKFQEITQSDRAYDLAEFY